MRTIDHVKILIIYTFFQSIYLVTNCQKIEFIDSSDVYILSIFNYKCDSLTRDYSDDFSIPNTTNTIQAVILKNDEAIVSEYQIHLITGDNKYNYISNKDTFHLKYIDSIIQKKIIANVLFPVHIYKYPLDSLDLSNSDSLFLKRFVKYKEQTYIKEYKLNQYLTNEFTIDIIDNRLINDLISVINGKSLRDGRRGISKGQCPFIETGIYYMLLKVKMVYIIINDENERFLGSFNPLELNTYNKNILICDRIPTKMIYYKKDFKNLLAIPLYVELLKPFNDINRFYIYR